MKAKSIFITTLLSLFILSGVWAQEKYEYAIVCVKSQGFKIEVTTSAGVQTSDAIKGSEIQSELLKKVEEMNAEGWEIYNVGVSQFNIYQNHFFYLRKKKN